MELHVQEFHLLQGFLYGAVSFDKNDQFSTNNSNFIHLGKAPS